MSDEREYGMSLVSLILELQHRVNKRLRIAAAMCKARNGAELQAEAERAFREITDQDGRMLRDYMAPRVEIHQDDGHDLRWRVHLVPRSAVDRLGELA